ncbi:MAG: NAD-dependent epimerase/dehydratase family protein [Actinomycetota bacterium]|nr:NAD-dependent epimerase/dehydratase family protein [Actinomycetota bacterium]
MKVAITGASGNVGTSLLRSLEPEEQVLSIIGIARRRPKLAFPKTEWVEADITTSDLAPLFEGCDAVVHLAWAIQPSHRLDELHRVNVDGSARVFEAVARAGVKNLIYASSVGAYSPGPKDETVDESWPTGGIATSFYARHKAQTEAMLDVFEKRHSDVRIVRLRPALIFKREAASGVRRLFTGPILPSPLLHRSLIPIVPDSPRLRFQSVHSYDIGEAYRLAIVSNVRGAFNIAADPVIDSDVLAELFDARRIPLPEKTVRALTHLTWRAHLQPTPVGWFDLGLNAPLMDVSRAQSELGWKPEFSATDALLDLIDGLREGSGLDTPPLDPATSGRFRVREFLTGVGARSGEP